MPIIAPVDNFFDLLRDGVCGFGEFGDGVGEGKNGLHGGNGPPHKSTFPAKDVAENFDNDLGIEPDK